MAPSDGFLLNHLDGLLGAGVVTCVSGALRLNDAALCAQRHRRDLPVGERCWCLICRSDRDCARLLCLGAYLQLLLDEDELDVEEIARVRGVSRPRHARKTGSQPWEPRPARDAA